MQETQDMQEKNRRQPHRFQVPHAQRVRAPDIHEIAAVTKEAKPAGGQLIVDGCT